MRDETAVRISDIHIRARFYQQRHCSNTFIAESYFKRGASMNTFIGIYP